MALCRLVRRNTTSRWTVRRLLLAAAVALSAAPAAAQADTHGEPRSPSPYHCTAPAHVGNGSRLAVAVDLPGGAVPPGTAQALGIHVTNLASTPTPDRTLIVVHGFVPNTYTADPGVTLTDFGTGISFTLPAGISPAATVSHTVTVKLGASIPPHATEHCDVTAFSGRDHATAAYDVVTGAPVVRLEAAVLPARGRAGSTIELDAVLGNAGPSNEYTGPAVFTFVAPEHTVWESPYAFRCQPGATRRILRCSYPGAPLTWRDEVEQLPLTIDAGVPAGTLLRGGSIKATDPFDPETFHGAEIRVQVTP